MLRPAEPFPCLSRGHKKKRLQGVGKMLATASGVQDARSGRILKSIDIYMSSTGSYDHWERDQDFISKCLLLTLNMVPYLKSSGENYTLE